MSTISRTRNPLDHNGTSQYERLLEALTPSYFKIDDRSFKDLLNASYEYARLLCYYNENNIEQGDWTCFWKVEMLTFLASLCNLDAEAMKVGYLKIKEEFQPILENATGDDFSDEQNRYHLRLIEYLRQQAVIIEESIRYLPSELPLKSEIIAMVQKDSITDTEQLASDLRQLIGFHKEAYSRVHGENLESFHYTLFIANHWGIPSQDVFYNDIDHSEAYRFNDQEELYKILNAFCQTFKKITLRANYWFDKNLETPQLRQPHVALFLTFLRLFDHARNSLNNLTQKHLEFYFRKILCLRNRDAVPDDAHLILELAATVNNHLIEKGTAFVAGKDKNGRPLIFQTLEDWFLNKTQVKDIKSTYIDVHGILRDNDGIRPRKILAAPNVRTAYKNGEELPNDTYEDWRGMADNIDLPDGEIGFAIASPQLILREGKRVIEITANTNILDLSSLNLLPEYFRLALSTKDGLDYLELNTSKIRFLSQDKEEEFETGSFNVLFGKIGNPSTGDDPNDDRFNDASIKIKIVLEKDDPPIESLKQGVDKTISLNDGWPFLKLSIHPKVSDEIVDPLLPTAVYSTLRKIKMDQIVIRVDVADIQENLIIQNDQGVFDGTQKFYPFGPIPEIGDRFYIGSTEVFQKALETLEIKLDWIAPPRDFNSYYELYRPNRVGRIVLEPAVQVDFIDRAQDENALEKVSKSGFFNSGVVGVASIRGTLRDIDGVPLNGVEVSVVLANGTIGSTNVSGTSGLPGEYILVNVPILANLSSKLRLTPFIPDDPALQDYEFITETEDLIVINAEVINVTLFPKKVVENSTSDFNDIITGQVANAVTGGLLNSVGLSVNSGASVPTGAFYTIDEGNLNKASFSSSDFEELELDFPTPYPLFPKIDVKLLPEQLPLPENRFIRKADISGTVINPANLAGIQVVANNRVAFTAQDGTFTLLAVPFTDNNAIGISFTEPGTFGGARVISVPPPITGDLNLNNINLFDLQVQPPTTIDVLAGTIDTFSLSGNLTLDNVGVEALIEVELNGSPVGSDVADASGSFEVTFTVEDSSSNILIKISHQDIIDFQQPIDLNRTAGGLENAIINFPIVAKFTPSPTNGDIRGKVTKSSPNGEVLSGVKVTYNQGVNELTVFTNSLGEYAMDIGAIGFGGRLTFAYQDFQTVTTGFDILNGQSVDVYLISQQVFYIIEGVVEDIAENPLGGVEIKLYNGITADAIEVMTFEPSSQDGTFSIGIPQEHLVFLENGQGKLEFSLGDNYEITKVLDNVYTVFSELKIRLHNKLNILQLIDQSGALLNKFQIFINTLNLRRDVRTQHFTKYTPTLKRGFLRLTLIKDDFLHGEYQNVLITSTIQASAIATADPTAPIGLPNPPYTPATNSIRLCYSSTQVISGDENEGIDNYYHIYPFNGYETVPLMLPKNVEETVPPAICFPLPPAEETDMLQVCLLPQYDKPTFKEELTGQLANGNLYIGLQGLIPGSIISLLFQMQEGSEQNPDVAAPDICWAYLTKDNKWKPLSKKQILKDTTNGLGRTGLVKLATPKEMSNETTLFEGGCYWLRAAVVEDVENGNLNSSVIGMPSIVDIRAQAIEVEFVDNSNEFSHLEQPLPVGEIKQLQVSRSAVKKIEQPFSSFNGQVPEEGNLFYVRVSERLRHSDRAVMIYDYERLLLDRFPKVQRAKCLNHTKPGTVDIFADVVGVVTDIELAPGYVTVAVIPGLGTRSGGAAAEPRFAQGDLKEMENYLRAKTNIFVACQEPQTHLRVVNPLYEEIQLSFNVDFKDGEDDEVRRFELDLAIKGFLAPWLFNQDHEIVFGRKLNRSKIILFLEQLSYVDAISDFQIIHCGQILEGNDVIPTTSRSILTTVIDLDDNPDTLDHKIAVVKSICREQVAAGSNDNGEDVEVVVQRGRKRA